MKIQQDFVAMELGALHAWNSLMFVEFNQRTYWGWRFKEIMF
jgi:hypothetical protein